MVCRRYIKLPDQTAKNYDQRNYSSYKNPIHHIQAGDVVVYPGHVAIYIGNGNIVEAQSTRAGITNSRPVNCHTITAIRRLV